MTKEKTTADAVAIAQFKFALIAPVLQGALSGSFQNRLL